MGDEKKREKQNSKKKTRPKERKRKKLKQVSDLTVCFSNFIYEVDVSQRTKKPIKKTLNQNKKNIYHLKNDKKIDPKKPCCSLCIINFPLTDIFKNNINV